MSDKAASEALLAAAAQTADAIKSLLDRFLPFWRRLVVVGCCLMMRLCACAHDVSVGEAQHYRGDESKQLELLQVAKQSLLPTTQTVRLRLSLCVVVNRLSSPSRSTTGTRNQLLMTRSPSASARRQRLPTWARSRPSIR
jgi:hypothetical protein